MKQAAQGADLHPLALYAYERGYLPIAATDLADLASFYGVDPSELLNPLGYPTPIEEDPSLSKGKGQRLRKALLSWPCILALFLAAAASVSLFVVGVKDVDLSRNHPESFYDAKVMDLIETMKEKGEVAQETDSQGETVTFRGLSYAAADGSTLTALTLEDSSSWLGFQTTFPLKETTLVFGFSETDSTEIAVSFGEYDSVTSSLSYAGSGVYEDGHYVARQLFDADGNDITTEDLLKEKQAVIQDYPQQNEVVFNAFTKEYAVDGGVAFHELLSLQVTGNRQREPLLNRGNNLILAFSLLGVLFIFLSLLTLILRLVRNHDAKAVAAPAPEVLPTRPSRSLGKNLSLEPFIPETALRLIVLAFVLTFSIVLFRLTTLIDGVSFTSLSDIIGVAKALSKNTADLLAFSRIWPLVGVASLLWFFVRIEVLQEKGNPLPSILLFFFFGILYYVAEYSFSYYFAANADSYHFYLIQLLTTFLPGNLFWGVCCFSLIVLFLLTTPQFIRSKKAHILWRSLVIVPIAYLLLSYFYSVGTSLWDWPVWPDYLANLLYRKQLTPALFAIAYPSCLYFYRRHLRKLYGAAGAETYFHGNRYFFVKNFFACGIIALIAIVNAAMQVSPIAATLDLKKNYWIALLIPLILFYHPHLGQRNAKVDAAIALAYGLFFSFGYLYLARVILFLR